MLIIVCYFKKLCGINQAENQATWPDLLHRHTIALASFQEWSVVSAWHRIRAQPRNPCQPRNSASASTCLYIYRMPLTPSSLSPPSHHRHSGTLWWHLPVSRPFRFYSQSATYTAWFCHSLRPLTKSPISASLENSSTMGSGAALSTG